MCVVLHIWNSGCLASLEYHSFPVFKLLYAWFVYIANLIRLKVGYLHIPPQLLSTPTISDNTDLDKPSEKTTTCVQHGVAPHA